MVKLIQIRVFVTDGKWNNHTGAKAIVFKPTVWAVPEFIWNCPFCRNNRKDEEKWAFTV